MSRKGKIVERVDVAVGMAAGMAAGVMAWIHPNHLECTAVFAGEEFYLEVGFV